MTTTTAPARNYILTIWNGEEIIVDPSDLTSLNWAKNIISKALKYNHPGEFKHTVAVRQIADIEEAIAALTPRPTTRATKSSELRPGQIVHFYGARFRLNDDRRVFDADSEWPVYVITGDWLDGAVIGGYFGPKLPWTFQGNDRATRCVEVTK